MKYLDKLLQVKNEDRSYIQVIIWWEIRRFLYNMIVFIAGFISTVIILIASSGSAHIEPGDDVIEPIMIPIFAVLCNIAYTLGWLTEVFINRSLTYGPKMFKRGLYFTLFWVFLPSTIWAIITIFELLKKIF